jgi:hypothetical protein
MQTGSTVPYVDLEGARRLAKVETVGADNFLSRKGLEVGLCTLALLTVWLVLAFYSLS